MLYGIIDIGSNTIRLTVYEADEATGTFTTFLKLKTMAGLVSYIDKKTGEMSEEGVRRLVGVCREYVGCAAHFREIRGPYAFATAGVRNARNCKDVLRRVREETGLAVELVSGREEAELGYVGAMHQSSLTKGVQIDVGGGSVEVTTFSHGKIIEATSLPHGSLSLFGAYVHDLLPTPAEADRIRAVVADGLAATEGFEGFTCKVASGVGGSVRAARRLRDAWMPGQAGGSDVTAAQIEAILERVAYDPHEAARDILRVAPERAHTCIPGLLVVQTVMGTFGAQRIEVHDFGVREGYLLTRVLGTQAQGGRGQAKKEA